MTDLLNVLSGKKTHLIVLALLALNLWTSEGVMLESGLNLDLIQESLVISLGSTFRSAITALTGKAS